MQQCEKNKRSSRTLWSAVLTLALSASMVPPADAATITVNGITAADCTLADAITSANTDTATGNCSAGSGADIIDLQTDVTLAAALPQVTSEVTITGNNHTISVNSGTHSRVLNNDKGDLIIKDTTISGGSAGPGAGIRNYEGNLTLNNCTISGNTAGGDGGGLYNFSYNAGATATLTIIDSTIKDNDAVSGGGGIANTSYYGTTTVTITNSTISGNAADNDGGGIYNYSYYGTTTVTITKSTISGNRSGDTGGGINNYNYDGSNIVTVTASTISGNSADGNGGGIYNYSNSSAADVTITTSTLSDNTAGGYGGGIENFDILGAANLTVTNCTISGNSAMKNGGGLDTYTQNGTITIATSTITGNTSDGEGGGVYSYHADNARLIIKGNLISGNEAATGGSELFNNTGILVLGGYNLLGHAGLDDAASFEGVTLSPTDVSATSDSGNSFALNAILSPLAYNGGPTMTQALPGGSPAIDLAPKSECSTAPFNLDQRGSIRPYGVGCDAGAYEYKSNILLMIVPVLAADSQH